jgi:hypothetical protein
MLTKIIPGLITLFMTTYAMATPITPYTVTQKLTDKIEIREYPKLLLATVTATDSQDNSSFRILFDFIDGANSKKQEIAMTAPVFEKYTANSTSMSFAMPEEFNLENLPVPDNKNIQLENMHKVSFIAIRFSGFASDSNFAEHKAILLEQIKKNNINADLSIPIKAYYNKPWTLPFLKRNELLFRVN